MQCIMRNNKSILQKPKTQQVINNERATPQQVSDALTKVRAAQTKIDD